VFDNTKKREQQKKTGEGGGKERGGGITKTQTLMTRYCRRGGKKNLNLHVKWLIREKHLEEGVDLRGGVVKGAVKSGGWGKISNW